MKFHSLSESTIFTAMFVLLCSFMVLGSQQFFMLNIHIAVNLHMQFIGLHL